MSGIVSFVSGIVGAVFDVATSIVNEVAKLAETLWKTVLVPVLEFVAGLFGITDEDVISTEVLVQRVISEDAIASDLMVKVVLEKQAAGEDGIIDRLMAYSEVSRGRYNSYFNHGKNDFIDGLPESNLHAAVMDLVEVKRIIDSAYGINCTITDSNLGSMSKDAYVGFQLQNKYKYKPYDNELTYNGRTYSVVNIDYNYSNDYYDVFIRSNDGGVEDNTQLVADAYVPVRYYTVKYYTVAASEWLYWVYEAGSGDHTTLDNSNVFLTGLEMLPIVTIRNGTVNTNADAESDRCKQSTDMLKYLGLELDAMTEAISSSPDIENIEDTFIAFGLQPSEDSEVVSKSLYEMFEYVYTDSGLLQDSTSHVATFKEGAFNAAIAWDSQSRVVTNGIIGSKGYYTHSIVGKNLVMKKQATEEQYVTITLNSLSSITFIDRDGLFGTVGKDVDQAGFFVPMSYFFVSKLSPLEQYELFNRSLLLINYSAQVTHLEWYETAAFMQLLKIVAIVITIISFGAMAWANGLVYALTWTLVGMAIAIGATMLLKMVMEATDNDFLKGLAAALYVVAMVYVASKGLPADANSLTTSVTLFATAISATSTAISIDTSIKAQKLEDEMGVWSQKVEALEAEQSAAEEALNVGAVSVEDVAFLQSLEMPNPYVERGTDKMMYDAIYSQYDYTRLYSFCDDNVGNFVQNRKYLG